MICEDHKHNLDDMEEVLTRKYDFLISLKDDLSRRIIILDEERDKAMNQAIGISNMICTIKDFKELFGVKADE